MGVRPGYKQTEVGVVPEEWDVEEFRDHFSISAGGDVNPELSRSEQDTVHCFPIYSNALTNNGLYGYCSYADHPAESITITARGTLGVATYRDHRYTAIGRVLVLEAKLESAGRFFAEFINGRIKFAIESTGVPQLTAPQINGYRLAVPPPPEQRAIATALSDVDALLGGLDRLIAKKSDLKQAALRQLLTGQTRLPGFRGEWQMKRLGDAVDTDPENLGADTRDDFTFGYIALEDVKRGFLRSHSEQVFAKAPSRARRKLRPRDILVSTVRPSLQSHLLFRGYNGDWVCSTGFCVVRCREGIAHPPNFRIQPNVHGWRSPTNRCTPHGVELSSHQQR